MDIKALINSIIEFLMEVIAGIQAAFDGIIVTKGYEDPKYSIGE